ALHWRHECDFLACVQDVIAINKFKACADQDAFVIRAKRWLLRINLLKQFPNGRALRKLELQLANSNQIAQLRVKLHPHFNPVHSQTIHIKNTWATRFPNLKEAFRSEEHTSELQS